MPPLRHPASSQALAAEADLRAAEAAAAAFAELLQFGRTAHPCAPRFSPGSLTHVAAASRGLANAVDNALRPTGLADAARQRADVAAQRVRLAGPAVADPWGPNSAA